MALLCAVCGSVSLRAPGQTWTFKTVAGKTQTGGWTDGTNSAARFYTPTGVCLDAAGNLYVADSYYSLIRKVTPVGTNWVVSTLAGTYFAGHADGTNRTASFQSPTAVALDASGNLFVADTVNNLIRKMVPQGTNWVVTTIAGTTLAGTNDGLGTSAQFYYPSGLSVDANGVVYVADRLNDTLRALTPVGTNYQVTTIAGLATVPGGNDGTNSDARFNNPMDIQVDSAGNLFVTDWIGETIRKVSPMGSDWVVTTIAGASGHAGSLDGTNFDAQFFNPRFLTIDRVGDVFVTDTGNRLVRKLTPMGTNWVVTTVVGRPSASGTTDAFLSPYGIAVDHDGNLRLSNLSQTIHFGRVGFPLAAELAGNQIVLRWPLLADAYWLESSGNLGPNASWQAWTNGVAVSDGTFVATNDLGGAALFFRLQK
jgi:hypothetical protein